MKNNARPTAEQVRAAIGSFAIALVVRRDALALVDAGFRSTTQPEREMFASVGEAPDMDTALEMAIGKEVTDLIDGYARDPSSEMFAAGRSPHTAIAAARRIVRARYRSGKCSLCKGPALPCARRHIHGRGCA